MLKNFKFAELFLFSQLGGFYCLKSWSIRWKMFTLQRLYASSFYSCHHRQCSYDDFAPVDNYRGRLTWYILYAISKCQKLMPKCWRLQFWGWPLLLFSSHKINFFYSFSYTFGGSVLVILCSFLLFSDRKLSFICLKSCKKVAQDHHLVPWISFDLFHSGGEGGGWLLSGIP